VPVWVLRLEQLAVLLELSLSERRIDLGGGRGPEPLAVVDLDQEEAAARSCTHAPSALSHPFSVAAG